MLIIRANKNQVVRNRGGPTQCVFMCDFLIQSISTQGEIIGKGIMFMHIIGVFAKLFCSLTE